MAPRSIDDDDDIRNSAAIVLEDEGLRGLMQTVDGILVACYSIHPLVSRFESMCSHAAVTGIFEASVLTAKSLTHSGQVWGIVTTGEFWEQHLSEGVRTFLGPILSRQFAGVFTSGLTAGELHIAPLEVVHRRVTQASNRLLALGNVGCVVMGCAGMAGLENLIRSAAAEKFGAARAGRLIVIDAVRAGVLHLQHLIRSGQVFTLP